MSARTEQLARAARDRGAASHCPRCGGPCACQAEFGVSWRCQVCQFLAEREQNEKEEETMNNTSSGERELKAFVEAECPFLFDGSAEAGGILDSDVAVYEFLVSAMKDGLEDATRAVAIAHRLDIREPADRREAMKLLDAQDPSWSMARNFDELSSAAQTNVIRSAKQLANRLVLQRRNRGTAGGNAKAMLDPGQAVRAERMEQVARQRGYDLGTHAGRRAALDDVYAEHPHLRPRLLRPGERQHVQGISGSGVGLHPHPADVLDKGAAFLRTPAGRTSTSGLVSPMAYSDGPAGAGDNLNGVAATHAPAPVVPRGGYLF
jgi:hypothetical protein